MGEDLFLEHIYQEHHKCGSCASTKRIALAFEALLGILFPNFSNRPVKSKDELKVELQKIKEEFIGITQLSTTRIDTYFHEKLPIIYSKLQKDIDAIYSGDPAAKSREEVIRSYPGFYAIAAYRIAHGFLQVDSSSILPRSITEMAHSKTGVDIHPGAKIGERFCIDHGTGVVIGETTEIGDNVKIYQGVTLGALSVEKNLADTKRHPTIKENVIIYSGATILGGNTVIGARSVIGGNVWLTKSVPEGSRVYYKATIEHQLTKETA